MDRHETERGHYSLALAEKIYGGGVALIFGLIVVHAPISVFFGSHFGHALLFKSWKELAMGGLAVLGAVVVTRRRAWGRLVRDPVLVTSALLALLYVVSFQYGHGFKPYAAGLLIDLRYVLFADLVYVAARLFPQSQRLFVRVGLVGSCVVVGFGLLQFVLPRDFLSVLGYGPATITPYTTVDSDAALPRLQSTLRGPNPLGAYAMVVSLVAGVAAVRARRTGYRWGLAALAVLAVVVLAGSYSRSAAIGLVVGALVAVIVLAGRRLYRPRVVAAVVVAAIVAGIGVYALRGTAFFSSTFKHEVAGSGPAVNSDDGHSASVAQAIHADLARPLGYGTGSTGSASLLGGPTDIVENQYLYVAHEAGILALAAFVALYAVLLRRAYARRSDPLALGVFASGIGLAVVGLLLPVFADDTVSIVWFGLAGLVAGSAYGDSDGRAPK